MRNKAKSISLVVILLLAVISVSAGVVKAEPYGWSPQVDFSNQGPPKCTDSKPDKAPILLQPNHPVLPKKAKKGEVVLYWHKVPGANGYNVYYGLSPKNYIFSAPNIGDTNNFTVGFLPNKTFYFAVQAKQGCAASGLSKEWAGRPGGGGYISPVLGAFKATPIKRTTAPSVGQSGSGTVVVPTVQSGNNAQVKGVQTENAQPTYQPPVYQPPVKNTNNNLQPAVPVTPAKPKGLLEFVLSLFGLGK